MIKKSIDLSQPIHPLLADRYSGVSFDPERDIDAATLRALAEAAQAIMGHSMGGHGALTIAMSFPGRFRSVSAFAPICNPCASDWGRKQFTAYLGEDEEAWAPHDATALMLRRGFDGPMLIDQGTADQYIDLLRPQELAAAMAEVRQGGTFRMQKGYDHSYFFVSTFMEEHMAFHGAALHA